MRSLTRRLALTGACALLALPATTLTTAAAEPPAAPPAQAACSPASTVTKKLPNGTTWRMCWHNDPTSGLVLKHVTYQPRHAARPIEVLGRAALAQIHVPYDNGEFEYNDVTEQFFGSNALPVAPKDCPNGTIKSFRVDNPDGEGRRTVKGLCVTTQPRGFAYHGDSSHVGEAASRVDSGQGSDLVVFTLNAIGWYHYITQWNFSDDGTITAKSGATGNLAHGEFDASDGTGWPVGKNGNARALSHQHNVLWKLDFKPDGSWKSRVERYDTKPDGTAPSGYGRLKTTRTPITKEFKGDNSNARWWRVVSTARNGDGHPRSWEIVQHHTDKYPARPYTRHDLYVTQYNGCETYASDNNSNGDTRCRDHVGQFVNGQTLSRPVLWVNVGFHHIARDEDQTPMPVHWQGFEIVPRDVTDKSPLTPDRLHRPKYNGEVHAHP